VILNVQLAPNAGASRDCTRAYCPYLSAAYDYDCRGRPGGDTKYTGPVRLTGIDL
jgi:hypothetical protein